MQYDDELNGYDDIDLFELIYTDSSSTNQYLIFEGSNNEVYAMNVSKIVEILTYKDLKMVKNRDSSIIRGTAKIRDEIATIINFDEWFENEVLDEGMYEYIIFAAFGGYNLGIMIKNVEYLVTIDSQNMKDNSMNNPKTNFIAEIKLHNENRLCTIFDCDRLLLDTFHEISHKNEISNLDIEKSLPSERIILFADDSSYIRRTVSSLFRKMGVKGYIFENGQELLNKLTKTDPDEVALIITDIEMPVMDGFNLIKSINDMDHFDDIHIIVHTNMSNFIAKSSLIELGVDEVINKIDMEALYKAIVKYFK